MDAHRSAMIDGGRHPARNHAGASVGVLFGVSGYASTFVVSAALLLVAALLAVVTSQLSAHSIRASS